MLEVIKTRCREKRHNMFWQFWNLFLMWSLLSETSLYRTSLMCCCGGTSPVGAALAPFWNWLHISPLTLLLHWPPLWSQPPQTGGSSYSKCSFYRWHCPWECVLFPQRNDPLSCDQHRVICEPFIQWLLPEMPICWFPWRWMCCSWSSSKVVQHPMRLRWQPHLGGPFWTHSVSFSVCLHFLWC